MLSVWFTERPCLLQDIKERTSQAATATDDPIARRYLRSYVELLSLLQKVYVVKLYDFAGQCF